MPVSVERASVGTSGWSYPSWKPGFYPADAKPPDFLRHYAEHFATVELNTTGYRLPGEGQFERWAEQTPSGFQFAPKLNAYRTSDLATFEERVTRLGDKLGPIRAVVGSKRDEGLLALMLGSLDPSLRIAFDFRHETWDGIEGDLPPNAVRVNDFDGLAPFRYLRFRDPPYEDAELVDWAGRIRRLVDAGIHVYAYFRHEDEPSAPKYAKLLTRLVAAPRTRDIPAPEQPAS